MRINKKKLFFISLSLFVLVVSIVAPIIVIQITKKNDKKDNEALEKLKKDINKMEQKTIDIGPIPANTITNLKSIIKNKLIELAGFPKNLQGANIEIKNSNKEISTSSIPFIFELQKNKLRETINGFFVKRQLTIKEIKTQNEKDVKKVFDILNNQDNNIILLPKKFNNKKTNNPEVEIYIVKWIRTKLGEKNNPQIQIQIEPSNQGLSDILMQIQIILLKGENDTEVTSKINKYNVKIEKSLKEIEQRKINEIDQAKIKAIDKIVVGNSKTIINGNALQANVSKYLESLNITNWNVSISNYNYDILKGSLKYKVLLSKSGFDSHSIDINYIEGSFQDRKVVEDANTIQTMLHGVVPMIYEKDSRDKYFKREHFLKLVNLIEQLAPIGPEIIALEKIIFQYVITEEGKEQKGLLGKYYGNNVQIISLRTKHIKLSDNKINDRIYQIYETFLHEYLHHFSQSYISGLPYYLDTKIMKNKENEITKAINWFHMVRPFNSAFSNKYISILNYDKSWDNVYNTLTPNQKQKVLPKNYKTKDSDNNDIPPLHSFYDQKDLWVFANGKNGERFNGGIEDIVQKLPPKIFFKNKILYNKPTLLSLSIYEYTFVERFARDYSQLFVLPINSSLLGLKNNIGAANLEYNRRDISYFQGNYQLNNDANDIASKRYLFNSPYEIDEKNLNKKNPRSSALFNLFKKYIGQKEGFDLSFIYSAKSDSSISFSNKSKYLRFGGFLSLINLENIFSSTFDSNKNSKLYLGIKENNQFKKISEARVFKSQIKKKESLNSNSFMPLNQNEDNYYWIVDNNDSKKNINDYIDASKILGKKLYLSNDILGTKTYLLNSFKGQHNNLWKPISQIKIRLSTSPSPIYSFATKDDGLQIVKLG